MIFCTVTYHQKIGPVYQFLVQLLGQLGLDISQKKLNSPSTEVIYLSIMFNTIDSTISIPKMNCHRLFSYANNGVQKVLVLGNIFSFARFSLIYFKVGTTCSCLSEQNVSIAEEGCLVNRVYP